MRSLLSLFSVALLLCAPSTVAAQVAATPANNPAPARIAVEANAQPESPNSPAAVASEPDVPAWLLILHAGSGVVALFIAMGAIATTKGGYWHRFWGRIYVAAMTVLCVTAVPMSFYQWNGLLLVILALSLYLTLTGWAVLRRKESSLRSATPYVAAAMLSVGCLATMFGSYLLDSPEAMVVTWLFCVAGLAVAVWDARRSRMTVRPRNRTLHHMARMLLAYTLTVTVYSILNFEAVSMPVRCLVPILSGTIITVLWVRHHRLKG